MNTRLENLALSALVALGVSVAVSGASPTPVARPTHGISTAVISTTLPTAPVEGPSDHDRLVALIRRVDKLQNTLAQAKQAARTAQTDIQYIAGCISGVYLATDPDTGAIVFAAGTEPDEFTAMVIDDSCTADIVEPGS